MVFGSWVSQQLVVIGAGIKSLYARENAGYIIYIYTHIWDIQPTAIRHLANQVGIRQT